MSNRLSQTERVQAAELWAAAKVQLAGTKRARDNVHCARVALNLLRSKYPKSPLLLRRRPARCIRRWGKALEKRGSMRDARRGIRKPALTWRVAKRAIKTLVDGYEDGDSKWQPFVSMGQALNYRETLRRIKRRYKMSRRGMWRCLCKWDKGLCLRTVQVKYALSDAQKKERRRLAEVHYQRARADRDYLLRTVFIDEKTMRIAPAKHGNKIICYVTSPVKYLSHPSKNWAKQFQVVVCYICAVSAILGAFYFRLITGTTRLDTHAKVSAPGAGP